MTEKINRNNVALQEMQHNEMDAVCDLFNLSIEQVASDFPSRKCTCGSGEPWQECHENSHYCG